MKRRIARKEDDTSQKKPPLKRARKQSARGRTLLPLLDDDRTQASSGLPLELWYTIMTFLKNRTLFGSVGLVCSSWRILSLRAVRRINFRNERWIRKGNATDAEIIRRFIFIQVNCPSARTLRLSWSNDLLPLLANQKLTELHIGGLQVQYMQRQIPLSVTADVLPLPSSLRRLSFSPHIKPTDDALAQLCARGLCLEELTIMDASLITDRGLTYLADPSSPMISSLRKLRLCCAKAITNEGASQLARLSQLEMLSLPCSRVSAVGIRHLAQLLHLQKLDLAYCKDVTDRALKSLPRSLRSLDLTATRITDRGLQYLCAKPASSASETGCPSPPPLLSPSLSFSTALRVYHQIPHHSSTLTRPISVTLEPQLPLLSKLKLNECFITDEGIKFLVPYLRSLVTLKLSSTFITSASSQALHSLADIARLEIADCSEPRWLGKPGTQTASMER